MTVRVQGTIEKKVPVTGWRLEYKEGSSYKYYEIFVTDEGHCILAWGRIGTRGQSKAVKQSYNDAVDLGMKQLYAKKSKGYKGQYEKVTFMVPESYLRMATTNGDAALLQTTFRKEAAENRYAGERDSVLRHYNDFSERAHVLLDKAGSLPFDEIVDEYQNLMEAWEKISDLHAEVGVTMTLAKGMLAQKLMGV